MLNFVAFIGVVTSEKLYDMKKKFFFLILADPKEMPQMVFWCGICIGDGIASKAYDRLHRNT